MPSCTLYSFAYIQKIDLHNYGVYFLSEKKKTQPNNRRQTELLEVMKEN